MIGACSVALRVNEYEVRLCRARCAAALKRAPSTCRCSRVASGTALCANPGTLDARSGPAAPGVGWRSGGPAALPAPATRRTRDPRSFGLRPALWRRARAAGISPSRGALPTRALRGTLTGLDHFWSTVLFSPVDADRSTTRGPAAQHTPLPLAPQKTAEDAADPEEQDRAQADGSHDKPPDQAHATAHPVGSPRTRPRRQRSSCCRGDGRPAVSMRWQRSRSTRCCRRTQYAGSGRQAGLVVS